MHDLHEREDVTVPVHNQPNPIIKSHLKVSVISIDGPSSQTVLHIRVDISPPTSALLRYTAHVSLVMNQLRGDTMSL